MQRRGISLPLHAREVLDILAFNREADTTACHRNDQCLDKRINRLDRLVRAVVDRNRVAARGGASHGQQAHRRHGAHFQNAPSHALIGFAWQAVASQFIHVIHGAINRFDPGFAPTQFIVEAGVLVEILKLLDRSWKIHPRLVECLAHLRRHRALHALLGVFGAVQNVALGGGELARTLEHHLNNVLHALDRWRGTAGLGRHDVNRTLCQVGHRCLRRAINAGKTAGNRILNPAHIE